ncbi:hypothetical protein F5877DRAFT_66609 [Lentinula edodes]|nr:hypothetical protein F5877DRAFT_66609 [Lentinula edodes]
MYNYWLSYIPILIEARDQSKIREFLGVPTPKSFLTNEDQKNVRRNTKQIIVRKVWYELRRLLHSNFLPDLKTVQRGPEEYQKYAMQRPKLQGFKNVILVTGEPLVAKERFITILYPRFWRDWKMKPIHHIQVGARTEEEQQIQKNCTFSDKEPSLKTFLTLQTRIAPDRISYAAISETGYPIVSRITSHNVLVENCIPFGSPTDVTLDRVVEAVLFMGTVDCCRKQSDSDFRILKANLCSIV